MEVEKFLTFSLFTFTFYLIKARSAAKADEERNSSAVRSRAEEKTGGCRRELRRRRFADPWMRGAREARRRIRRRSFGAATGSLRRFCMVPPTCRPSKPNPLVAFGDSLRVAKASVAARRTMQKVYATRPAPPHEDRKVEFLRRFGALIPAPAQENK